MSKLLFITLICTICQYCVAQIDFRNCTFDDNPSGCGGLTLKFNANGGLKSTFHGYSPYDADYVLLERKDSILIYSYSDSLKTVKSYYEIDSLRFLNHNSSEIFYKTSAKLNDSTNVRYYYHEKFPIREISINDHVRIKQQLKSKYVFEKHFSSNEKMRESGKINYLGCKIGRWKYYNQEGVLIKTKKFKMTIKP